MKECLKLVSYDRDRAVCVLLSLALLLMEADVVPKEGFSKKNLVSAFSSNGGKVIFILLTEVITFYVGLTVV